MKINGKKKKGNSEERDEMAVDGGEEEVKMEMKQNRKTGVPF